MFTAFPTSHKRCILNKLSQGKQRLFHKVYPIFPILTIQEFILDANSNRRIFLRPLIKCEVLTTLCGKKGNWTNNWSQQTGFYFTLYYFRRFCVLIWFIFFFFISPYRPNLDHLRTKMKTCLVVVASKKKRINLSCLLEMILKFTFSTRGISNCP